MDFDSLMVSIRAIDNNNTILIIALAGLSFYFMRELLQPAPWVQIAFMPALLASAFVGVAVMRMAGWFISTEEATNTVIGAIGGITTCFLLGALLLRVAAIFDSQSLDKPYRSRYPAVFSDPSRTEKRDNSPTPDSSAS